LVTNKFADDPHFFQSTLFCSPTQHHWAIENSFHWVLDVTFDEDASRIRSGDSAANMAVLRAVALNLLKADTTKSSLRQKRLRAAVDNDFLFRLLN